MNADKRFLFLRDDAHRVLSEAFRRTTIEGRTGVVIEAPFIKVGSDFRFVRVLLLVLGAPLMALRAIWNSRGGSPLVIREFSNAVGILLLIPLFPLRRRVYFNINHNLKGFPARFPEALRLLAKSGFNFIMFDGHDIAREIPREVSKRFFVGPFPVAPFVSAHRVPDRACTVGLVGDFRGEKASKEVLVNILARLAQIPDTVVKLGVRGAGTIDSLSASVEVVRTKEAQDYFRFLKSVDIVVILAEANAYYARHSGTIMDAIASHAVVVAPDLPVFRQQISSPAIVGLVYRSVDELPEVVGQARAELSDLRARQASYVAGRATCDLKCLT